MKNACLLTAIMICAGCTTAQMQNETIYRINCGSDEAYVDEAGREWAADFGYSKSRTALREASLPIHKTDAPKLYRSERWGVENYTLPVEPGTYTVRLHFTETFDSNYCAGRRSFDVSVNGRSIVDGLDPYAAAGGFALPVIFEYAGCPAEDAIRIDFKPSGAIYAIEVFKADSGTEPSIRQITPVSNPAETFIGTELEAALDTTTLKILFIGNSMTFYWAIPESLQTMLETGTHNLRIEPTRSLYGGKSLEYHYNETDAVELIKSGGFDYVVLQPHSKLVREQDPAMFEYTKKLNAVIRASGAIPLLYARPAGYHADDNEHRSFQQTQMELAESINAPLIPGAEVIRRCIKERPDLRFHNTDTVHMGMYGGYAIACTFYAALTGGTDFPPPAILAQQVAIDPDIATFIQKTAFETVREYTRPLPAVE